MIEQNTNNLTESINQASENSLIEERKEKLQQLRNIQANGGAVAFPNDFKPQHRAAQLHQEYATVETEQLAQLNTEFTLAGRIMLKRVMGKASFITIQDATGKIQLYIALNAVGEQVYSAFKTWDLGDIVAASGKLFKTKTGELSVKVQQISLLTKSLRPLPDKFHGIADQEVKYRQRYVDLIINEDTKERFRLRSKVLFAIRNYMMENQFLEVETPMLHPIPGGANAKPFITHHNALDQDMYLRIAPELYLKRLIVGGYERVFEVNRSYRNEGISVRHNPEFTMMEFYAAYWNYQDLMQFTEELLRNIAQQALGKLEFSYQGKTVDLTQPFERLTITQAILKYTQATEQNIQDKDWLANQLEKLGLTEKDNKLSTRSLAALQVMYFEELVEQQLWQPTYIMEHPTEISPLARANDKHPEVTERFELYITGRELANGFSELNDAQDQAQRFLAQVAAKDSGDDEAMFYDHDFIRALEYGMPPTGGCGIGIDRLMMLLTDSPSIRDVILFPALRKEKF